MDECCRYEAVEEHHYIQCIRHIQLRRLLPVRVADNTAFATVAFEIEVVENDVKPILDAFGRLVLADTPLPPRLQSILGHLHQFE